MRHVLLPLLFFAFLHMDAHPPGKLTAGDYLSLWKDEAIYQMAAHGVPASITLAQGMLESGNGNSRLAIDGNNHFGIKCHSDWTGKTIREDDETRAECFRKYSNARESFDDHSVFLKKKRYVSLFELKVTDYKGWAHGLKQCGYATNPQYPQLLIRLIETHSLAQYDEIGLGYIKKNKLPERSVGTSDLAEHKPEPQTKQKRKGWDPDSAEPVNLSTGRSVQLSANRVKYVIARAGDSIESIAADLEMAPWQIRKYNDLNNGEALGAGALVYLQPKRSSGSEPTYVVKEGDTMRGVSQLFGMRLNKLYKKNKIESGKEVSVGTTLRLR